ncbi:MAG: hypothetical protein A2506_00135 [Elusimicrobia bacterium RIFOXYD12_FULL_66_9]|nr:MAG: hypothetical protein A2506_00135 [Elusimicrobia bacterium RIFOXYD12_FULL_66_9]
MYNEHLNGLQFAWDESKECANRLKHGVSFSEAAAAFNDPHARRFFDSYHSEDEDRFILLGMSSRPRLLVVCHCYREEGRIIRIISARKADAEETQAYHLQRHDA